MAYRFTFLLVLFLSIPGRAAETFLSDPWTIRFSLLTPNYSLDALGSSQTTTPPDVTFTPNTRTQAGISISRQGLFGIGFSSVQAQTREEQLQKGTTAYSDGRLNFAFRSWLFSLSYATYTGFYISNLAGVNAVAPTNPYTQLPDMTAQFMQFHTVYVVSPESFSMPAAIDQSERQASSGGSWLFGLSAGASIFSNPTAFIPTAYQANFGADKGIRSGQFNTLLLEAGGGYTIGSRFALTGVLLFGAGFQNCSYNDGTLTFTTNTGNSNQTALVNIGYNGDGQFFGGFTTQQTNNFNLAVINMKQVIAGTGVYYGLRF